MQILEIAPGVFACLVGSGSSNAGVAVTDQGVIVIDTLNSPEHGRHLADAIEAHTGTPVLFVVNTHHHFDHLFGNQAFSAPVIAHCALAGQLAERAAQQLAPDAVSAWVAEHPGDRRLAEELELIYPNVLFDQRLVLDLPPLLVLVQHPGGHTPDSSIVDLPDEAVLFAGALVFEGRVPFLGQAHFGDLIKALRDMQALGERTIVPGQGELCDMSYVRHLLDYVQLLCGRMAELIGQGWEKNAVLDSDHLPTWWTDDRPDLLRLNLERLYDELAQQETP
jgi:cyclase